MFRSCLAVLVAGLVLASTGDTDAAPKTPPPPPTPTQPLVVATMPTSDSIAATWRPTLNTTGYVLRISADGGRTFQSIANPPNPYLQKALLPGRTYILIVDAIGPGGKTSSAPVARQTAPPGWSSQTGYRGAETP